MNAPHNNDWFGHPPGLSICFLTEMWERFSFYGMKALLLLYLIKYHLFSDDYGYNLIGAYGGLVYAAPVFGGVVADRWLGIRKSVLLGGVLLACGHFGLAYEGQAARLSDGVVIRDTFALQVFYASLALIVVGVGFLKPNISTAVGRLYADGDPRREAGFSIYYAGINLGAVLASLICAWLGETFGWRYGFGAAGVGMLIGLCTFIAGQRYLGEAAAPPQGVRLRERIAGPLTREALIYLAALAGVAVAALLLQAHSLMLHLAGLPPMSAVLWAMHAVSAVLLAGIGWFMLRHCTAVQRRQMAVLLLLIVCALAFFTLYEQAYGSWLLFSDRVMDRRMQLFGWRYEWTAGQLTFLGALFILLLAPLFAWLWPWLDRRGRNPDKVTKSALGLIFAGLSFLLLVWSARHPLDSGLTALWWFVAAYFVLEIGEMLLSPVGLAAVTELSVPRVAGLMMGAWWLGTAYSEVLAALFGKLAAIELPEGGVIDVADALGRYDALFLLCAQLGIAAGVLLLLAAPLLRRALRARSAPLAPPQR